MTRPHNALRAVSSRALAGKCAHLFIPLEPSRRRIHHPFISSFVSSPIGFYLSFSIALTQRPLPNYNYSELRPVPLSVCGSLPCSAIPIS
ncbi:Carboxyl-terminal-processing protease [Corchorus olitorius]|uniref:Carboxyl-terminal-processing protease n=1 Tax=Corchorus olitorius TaxID=93759 RepID=A0A1R3KVT7_9ROSI|nr:Carboxyl-terminal-processing protease [Corchorus olitorius]